MKAGLLKTLFLTIAVGFAASVQAGESGGVTRPPSIPSGNIYQGYHPLGINVYAINSSFLSIYLPESEMSLLTVEAVQQNPLLATQSSAAPTPSQGIPEPSSAVLAAIGVAALARLRRLRRS